VKWNFNECNCTAVIQGDHRVPHLTYYFPGALQNLPLHRWMMMMMMMTTTTLMMMMMMMMMRVTVMITISTTMTICQCMAYAEVGTERQSLAVVDLIHAEISRHVIIRRLVSNSPSHVDHLSIKQSIKQSINQLTNQSTNQFSLSNINTTSF